jgi:hypothetical protein
MKSIISAFVALALIGAVAPTVTLISSQNKIIATQARVDPIPTCPPDEPSACSVFPDSGPSPDSSVRTIQVGD